MAGLLDGVLPFVYGQSNRLKRHVNGLLSDPLGSIAQTAGLIQDKRKEQQGLMDRAYGDPKSLKITDKDAWHQAAGNLMNGPMGFAPVGMTAWHGTPHLFDKFDSSKIGTGEGAQVYGHGLYLAENPAVAKQYAEGVMDKGYLKDVNGKLSDLSKQMEPHRAAEYGKFKTPEGQAMFDQYHALMAERSARLKQGGNTYKVDLPDDKVAKMLDWDKPLSQQPQHIQDALRPHGFSAQTADLRASEVYNRLTDKLGGQSRVSEWLRQDGIPGIRYLDGGSRGTGGTSNFVVFPGEESALKILERNGQPLGF